MTFHGHSLLAKIALDVALDRQILVEADERSAFKSAMAALNVPCANRMTGRNRDHHFFFPPGQGDHFARGFGIAHQPEVGLILHTAS